jgi:uncharacterized membrane protein YgcG
MAAYNSQVSAFTINSVLVPAIGSMSLSSQRPPQDVTPIGAANTYILSGTLATVVALDVYYNKADHDVIVNDLWNPVGFACEVIFNDLAAPLFDRITGQATCISADIVSVTSDVVRGSFVLQFYGLVQYNGNGPLIGAAEFTETLSFTNPGGGLTSGGGGLTGGTGGGLTGGGGSDGLTGGLEGEE